MPVCLQLPASLKLAAILLCVLLIGTASIAAALAALSLVLRARSRRRRSYVRLKVLPYRGDEASAESLVAMFDALHKRLLRRWWRRLSEGQPSLSLEVHFDGEAWFALCCQAQSADIIQAALRTAYPNCKLCPAQRFIASPPSVLRLKKRELFIKRVKTLDARTHAREPSIDGLVTAMAASGGAGFVQVALTPAPTSFQRRSKRLYKRHEARLSRQRGEGIIVARKDRSLVEDSELKGGLAIQHKPLFFTDIRIVGAHRRQCERIASQLRAETAENALVERGTSIRHGLFHLYTQRVLNGEGNPQPSTRKGVFASTELAAIWHLPSIDYVAVPFHRSPVPFAPASPAILRTQPTEGVLRDELGGVSIHPRLRKQNVAVTGAVEQGKSSYLVASVREDLRRKRCAIIVLDPKGDAADAAISVVPERRVCTVLDFSHPSVGFNPLASNAPADVIADYVVAALKNLFTDGDIRASSDRYLRNAIIAVLAYNRRSTLWDAARLLSVGADGYAYRTRVGARVSELPEFKEIAQFFTAELTAQLADARSATTAKLDAPVNKLARLLNSPSIKRILLNDSLLVDFDEIIAKEQVLIVKGALGEMGAGNTSVLMQLLVGMLDAALARQQDRSSAAERVAVALKVDEAPLVFNKGFAETMALKRSAGLETLACWQTDAQWVEREVRDQLDALFAHRVCFATASVEDARKSARLLMAEFSDSVRPRIEHLSALGHPDARLRLPKHCAIASWTTEAGRQPPFIGWTLPLSIDAERLAFHSRRQALRGGSYKDDLSQPHWEREGADRVTRPIPDARSESKHDASLAPGRVSISNQDASAASDSASISSHDASHRLKDASARQRDASAARAGAPTAKAGASALPSSLGMLPSAPAQSFRELVDLDTAQSVRVAAAGRGSATRRSQITDAKAVSGRPGRPGLPSRALAQPSLDELDDRDIAILLTVAGLRHASTSQIHRRLHREKSITTTQRRLKRLADIGLIERLQFHMQDGAGVPMCCTATLTALVLLKERGLLRGAGPAEISNAAEVSNAAEASNAAGPSHASAKAAGDSPLRLNESRAIVKRDLHAAGWALAFEAALDCGLFGIVGPRHASISPPARTTPGGVIVAGPASLRLPNGRMPHRFVRSTQQGRREEVERFETIRPQLRIEPLRAREDARSDGCLRELDIFAVKRGASVVGKGSAALQRDVLVELDDRVGSLGWTLKLERYDHFLTGWCLATPRYRRKPSLSPLVVFVCRDRRRARECARLADQSLVASRAYAGERPADWEYVGRESVVFVSERDVHEGVLYGYGVPRLPPEIRLAASGDGGALAPAPVVRSLLDQPNVAQGDA